MNVPRPALVGYLILLVAVLLGLWRVEQVANDVAQVAEQRTREVCAVQEQLRDIVRRLVVESAGGDDAEDDRSPAEVERRQRFLDRSFELLDEASCPLPLPDPKQSPTLEGE